MPIKDHFIPGYKDGERCFWIDGMPYHLSEALAHLTFSVGFTPSDARAYVRSLINEAV